jgi:FkbM family methyltransferase
LKKIIQNIAGALGYSIIKKKNFFKIQRTLDAAIKNKILKDNPIILDVGAHEGESIVRFKNIFKDPHIHSFEPQEESFNILKRLKNKNIFVNNFALGSKEEIKDFYINSNDATSSFIPLDNSSKHLKGITTIKNKKINLKKLDDYVAEKEIDYIDLLKIDVQGYETEVLLGSLKSLSNKIKMIEVEICFVEYYKNISSFYNIEKIINEQFELYALSSPVARRDGRIKVLDALYIKKVKNLLR